MSRVGNGSEVDDDLAAPWASNAVRWTESAVGLQLVDDIGALRAGLVDRFLRNAHEGAPAHFLRFRGRRSDAFFVET